MFWLEKCWLLLYMALLVGVCQHAKYGVKSENLFPFFSSAWYFVLFCAVARPTRSIYFTVLTQYMKRQAACSEEMFPRGKPNQGQ